MYRPLTNEEKRAIRRCLHHYVALARKLRSGLDVTEELKDEFERRRFSPVYLITRAEARAKHVPTCSICAQVELPKPAEPSNDEMRAIQNLHAAADYYLGLGPGIVESAELQRALTNVIVAHWHALHPSGHQAVA